MLNISFFNQDSAKHRELVAASSRRIPPVHKEKLFPLGETQIGNVILSLSTLCRFDATANSVEYYSYIINFYTYLRIELEYYQASIESIVAAIRNEFPKLELDSDTARATIRYCELNINDPTFAILQETDLQALNEMPSFVHAPQNETYFDVNPTPKSKHMPDAIAQQPSVVDESFLESFSKDPIKTVSTITSQIIEKNADLIDPWEGDPEHGLVLDKPIYVNGVEGSKSYLASLRTILGEKLIWNRTGSFSIAGINGMVDKYESKTVSGVAYKTVCLNMYATNNSTTPPKGFKYIN